MSDPTITEATSREVALMKSRMEAQMGRQRTLLERQAAYARDRIAADLKMLPSARQRLAENLHAIIEEACAATLPGGRRITKAAITDAAGMSDGNGKSTRLYQYALDPALPADERQKRAKARLTQNPAGYLKLAQKAAELAGLDTARVVVDLVQGTWLAQGMDAIPEVEEAEHLVMLAKAIQGQAKRITRETGLDWYYRTINDHDLVAAENGWEGDTEAFMWRWQNVPWINLFTEQVACFKGTWHPTTGDHHVARQGQEKAVYVCRHVALGLAPFGHNGEVRAYLVRRPALVIAKPPRRAVDNGPLTLTEIGNIDLNPAQIVHCFPGRDGWLHTGGGALHVEGAGAIRSVALCPAEELPGDDHDFIEVSAASLAEALETGLPLVPSVDEDALIAPLASYTKSPPASRAARLEQVILYGQHFASGDDDSRLMARLEAKVRVCVEGLRVWIDKETARIEERMSSLAMGEI